MEILLFLGVPILKQITVCGVRVAVSDSSVAEGRRWRKPYLYMQIQIRTYTCYCFVPKDYVLRLIEHDWIKHMFIGADTVYMCQILAISEPLRLFAIFQNETNL